MVPLSSSRKGLQRLAGVTVRETDDTGVNVFWTSDGVVEGNDESRVHVFAAFAAESSATAAHEWVGSG